MMRQRLTAFGVHLGISVLVCSVLLFLLITRWYPQPFFWVDGGWPGLRLVTAVDLVIGPLLTAIVFNRAKGRGKLAFDLAAIGLLQVAALFFGIWTVYTQRTVLAVFSDGAFYTLDADAVAASGGRAPAVVGQSATHPAFGVLRLPPEGPELKAMRVEAIRSRRPLYSHGELMEALGPDTFSLIAARGLNLERWAREKPGREQVVEALKRRFPEGESAYVYVPAHARYGSLLLVFSRVSGQLVGNLQDPKVS